MSTRLSAYLAAAGHVRSPFTSLLSLLHHFFGPSRVLQHGGAMVLIVAGSTVGVCN